MHPHPTVTDRARWHGPAGFSLIGFAIAVAVISIAAAVVLPVVQRLVRRSRSAAVASDLHAFSAAFKAYALEHGDWPDGDGSPAAIPPGMDSALRSTHWRQPTPIGGHYAWDPNGTQQGGRYRAAIEIASTPGNPVSTDRALLLDLDRKLDDGNLTTGRFLLGYRNYPLFVLEH